MKLGQKVVRHALSSNLNKTQTLGSCQTEAEAIIEIRYKFGVSHLGDDLVLLELRQIHMLISKTKTTLHPARKCSKLGQRA